MNRKRGVLAAGVLLALAGPWWSLHRATSPLAAPPSPPAAGIPVRASAPAASPGAPASLPAPGPVFPAPSRTATLLVRDAVTKEPLPGARVFLHRKGRDIESGSTPDPACLEGEVPVIADDCGRTPVPPGSLHLHVVAAGHRWGVPAMADEGLVADLPPGGAVRLSIGRWVDLEEPLVFAERGAVADDADPAWPSGIYEEDEEGITVVEAGFHGVPGPSMGREATLDEGLEPGTWTYFVRRGTRDGEIYARGVVTVAEGETADLRLEAVPVTAGPRLPVKAVVHIPERWKDAGRTYIEDFDVEVASESFIADPEPFLSLKGLDPLNRHLEATAPHGSKGPDGRFHVTLRPDLPAGRYRAAVGPMEWVTEVEVSGPAPEVRIDLPEPGEVRVTLLDASTGKPVPKGWVRWAPSWKGLPRGRMTTVSVDGKTGTAALLAPPGVVHADLGADGYLDAERDLAFDAGAAAEVTVTLRPAAILVVRLKEDGKPFEGGGWVEAALKADSEELERLAGESETGGVVTSQASGFRGGEARIDGLWGGPHEVTVTHLPGFEPVPPRRVEVRFGTETVVEFDLVRAK